MPNLLNYTLAWEECLRTVVRECNPAILLRLLNKRPEHTDPGTNAAKLFLPNLVAVYAVNISFILMHYLRLLMSGACSIAV